MDLGRAQQIKKRSNHEPEYARTEKDQDRDPNGSIDHGEVTVKRGWFASGIWL
jgi:hypothetical protein